MDWLRCGDPFRSVIGRCVRRTRTRMIVVILVGLLGVWMFGSVECGRNCTSHDIRCVHGQCVDESQTSKARPNDTRSSYGGNKTPKVSCLCDPLWSGLGCDVFSCTGRTQWVFLCLMFFCDSFIRRQLNFLLISFALVKADCAWINFSSGIFSSYLSSFI